MGWKIELKGRGKKGREITDRILRGGTGKKLAGYWIYGFISAAPPLFETLKSFAPRLMFERKCFVLVFDDNNVVTKPELERSIFLKNNNSFFIIVKTFFFRFHLKYLRIEI